MTDARKHTLWQSGGKLSVELSAGKTLAATSNPTSSRDRIKRCLIFLSARYTNNQIFTLDFVSLMGTGHIFFAQKEIPIIKGKEKNMNRIRRTDSREKIATKPTNLTLCVSLLAILTLVTIIQRTAFAE